MFFVDEGFTFRNFLVDAITIFVFVVMAAHHSIHGPVPAS